MKPTPFIKRVLSTLFSGICLAALTLGSANQLAMAEITISGTTESLSGYSVEERSTIDSAVIFPMEFGYVLYIKDSASLTSLDKDISAEYTSAYATDNYAVYNYGTIANVASGVTITATASKEASVKFLTGLCIAADASITNDMAATITVSNSNGSATGIENGGTIGGAVSGNISVTSTGDNSSYGILNNGTIKGNVSGDITLNNTSGKAFGIQNFWSTIDGAISGEIIVSSTGGSCSYGICNYGGTIGDISGDITVSSSSAEAIQVYGVMESGDGIGTISSTITAKLTADTTPDGSTAAALYYGISTRSQTATFADGASLSASGAATNYAIYTAGNASTQLTLTATTSTAQISLTGDISANLGALSIESGHYVLEGGSTTITASSMSISSGASLTLTGNTTFDITDGVLTLDLSETSLTELLISATDVDSVISSALLTIESGASISGLDSVNIVLSSDDSANWNTELLNAIISDDSSALGGVSYSVTADGASIDSGEFSVIPEPSTATLSLLALAGLCARRRRKAA